MDYSDFANFLNERMQERGLTTKRLSELSGISIKHLEALRQGQPVNLPSAPYLRGYLLKLGRLLDFDAGYWWEAAKNKALTESPGQADEPPKNRFKKEPVKKYFLLAAVGLILFIYLSFRASKILGRPVITIANPSENLAVVSQDFLLLTGKAANADYLKINGETIPLTENGDWQKRVSLQPGINTIELVAGNFLGRETKIMRQIIYQPPKNAASSTNPSIINN